MQRPIDRYLQEVRQGLLGMGGQVEEMISLSIRSLVDRDDSLAEQVIAMDRDVDRLEKEIDEQCLDLFALQQPTASDLRLLVAAMKIVNDLERMGDSAVNIAQSVKEINREPPLKPYIDLPHLAEMAKAMVRRSLDSFVERDSDLARRVCARDDDIDDLYHQLFRELLTFMIEDPRDVTRCLHLLLVARNLERIADHATNVAEDVIYYVEARDIRHSGSEEEE